MSYEKVKSIRLVNDENGWYAVITSADSSIRPLHYTKWNYLKNKCLTKEQLQAKILLDFYYGNFHGGTSTKYGKFLKFLGGYWGCANENSRACQAYHFYEKITNIIRNKYTNQKGFIEDDSREICYTLIEKIRQRQEKEVKTALYKEFQQFKTICKPTIIRVWRNSQPTGEYIYQYKRQKSGVCLTTSYKKATVYTDINKLAYIKRILEQNRYKAELIEV